VLLVHQGGVELSAVPPARTLSQATNLLPRRWVQDWLLSDDGVTLEPADAINDYYQ